MLYIDRESKIPIYVQIYEHIKRDILSGNMPVESRISSTRCWPMNYMWAETWWITLMINLSWRDIL